MALLVWHSRQETLATELAYEQYIQTVAPLYNQLNELEKELPGNENCITMEQFQELINAGWTTCIYVSEYTDVPKYLSSFSEKLTELEIEIKIA